MDSAAHRAFPDQKVAIQGLLDLALLSVLLQPFRDANSPNKHLDHLNLQLQCQGVDCRGRRPIRLDWSLTARTYHRLDHRLVVLQSTDKRARQRHAR